MNPITSLPIKRTESDDEQDQCYLRRLVRCSVSRSDAGDCDGVNVRVTHGKFGPFTRKAGDICRYHRSWPWQGEELDDSEDRYKPQPTELLWIPISVEEERNIRDLIEEAFAAYCVSHPFSEGFFIKMARLHPVELEASVWWKPRVASE